MFMYDIIILPMRNADIMRPWPGHRRARLQNTYDQTYLIPIQINCNILITVVGQ